MISLGQLLVCDRIVTSHLGPLLSQNNIVNLLSLMCSWYKDAYKDSLLAGSLRSAVFTKMPIKISCQLAVCNVRLILKTFLSAGGLQFAVYVKMPRKISC